MVNGFSALICINIDSFHAVIAEVMEILLHSLQVAYHQDQPMKKYYPYPIGRINSKLDM